jgi:hypothetical protein
MIPAAESPRMTKTALPGLESETYIAPDCGPIATDVGELRTEDSGGPPSPELPFTRGVPISVEMIPLVRFTARTM